ncbi:MAG: hypothetical protein RLZZ290_838 [Pseudomonadota bacterium]|jgi:hypothetical protein
MDKISIAATARTPAVEFDPQARTFVLSGESYPEDPFKFFADPLASINAFLQESHDGPVHFEFRLTYFNSSSAKVLMDLFCTLEESAERGNDVSVDWVYAEDDDNMLELGEEFSEELSHAKFTLKAIAE